MTLAILVVLTLEAALYYSRPLAFVIAAVILLYVLSEDAMPSRPAHRTQKKNQ